MFTAEFLEQLADAVAAKVVERIERRASTHAGLSEWLDRYGPTMTREQVADVMKVTYRAIQKMETAGKLHRANSLNKRVTYETEHVFSIVTNGKTKQYANR